jgi:hypothetical protein
MKFCTLETPIIDCPVLSRRTKGALYRSGLRTIQDILNFGPENILNIHNAGRVASAEVQELITKFKVQQNEYFYLEEVRSILKNVLARESKRHMMDEHLVPGTSDVIEEIILMLEEQLDYDPTPNEPGEPPITAAEMHAAAWKEHQEMHR